MGYQFIYFHLFTTLTIISQVQLNLMQRDLCLSTQDCDQLYYCLEGRCIHDDIFPLSAYTMTIYMMMGLAASFCNIAGQSMGIFKILILIILLQYQLNEATGLAQAMVVGTAIPNFLSVILKKHPNERTSLVNYKLLLIIIPCCLLGSTVGSLSQTFIPKIGQLAFSALVFIFFAYKFILKLRLTYKQTTKSQLNSSLTQSFNTTTNILSETSDYFNKNDERYKIQEYEKSYHLPEILLTIIIFIAFQGLSFLLQGILPFYNLQRCSISFCLGIIALFAITFIYLFILYGKFKSVYTRYRKYGIPQQVYLNKLQQFLKVCAGGFAAGAIQGILGMGCGTCIVTMLLSFPIAPTSAIATSGYQILFTGAASLGQYYINGQIQPFETVWMLGVCLVIGGSLTIFLYHIIKRLNHVYVNRFLYFIIVLLCLMSIGLVIPTVKHILDRQGWDGLMSISFKC